MFYKFKKMSSTSNGLKSLLKIEGRPRLNNYVKSLMIDLLKVYFRYDELIRHKNSFKFFYVSEWRHGGANFGAM